MLTPPRPSLLLCGAVVAIAYLPPMTHAAATAPSPATPSAGEILALVKPEHPRLLGTAADFGLLRRRVSEEPALQALHRRLVERGNKILREPPSKYEIPDGKRLLATSRRVVDRTYTLAMLYRLDGDRKWVQRAWAELEAAAGFKDWNPSHFLDTAEMTHAFAIGYDWLFDAWSQRERDVLRGAMVEKGLRPGIACYRGQAAYGWWTRSVHNWNQVCNGGLGTGALALATEEPELAGEVLANAVRLMPRAMVHYGPDGAWAEGPGYWAYATRYTVALLAALRSATGSDFGLSQVAGLDQAGHFPIYMAGPTGGSFNFADAKPGAVRPVELLWLAARFQQPAYAAFRQHGAETVSALDLLWHASAPPSAPAALPLDRHFRVAEVASFRSDWTDPDALFVGFKAGDNKVNHSNLDLGTLVVDALGVRWAIDLGPDNYNLPEYFGQRRWTYYRLRAEGHNTLVIGPGAGPDQDPKAATPITRFVSQPDGGLAVADLTAAYAAQAVRVRRGIALPDRRSVVLRDEAQLKAAADIWWFLHTAARAELAADGRSALLTQAGKSLSVRLLEPAGAKLELRDAAPLPASPNPKGQEANQGVRKLAVCLAGARDATILVQLAPHWAQGAPPLPTADAPCRRPLDQW